jgi:cytochrome b subunit of formate dehydrogenase
VSSFLQWTGAVLIVVAIAAGLIIGYGWDSIPYDNAVWMVHTVSAWTTGISGSLLGMGFLGLGYVAELAETQRDELKRLAAEIHQIIGEKQSA